MASAQDEYMSEENQRKIREANRRSRMTPAERKLEDGLAKAPKDNGAAISAGWLGLKVAGEKIKKIGGK